MLLEAEAGAHDAWLSDVISDPSPSPVAPENQTQKPRMGGVSVASGAQIDPDIGEYRAPLAEGTSRIGFRRRGNALRYRA